MKYMQTMKVIFYKLNEIITNYLSPMMEEVKVLQLPLQLPAPQAAASVFAQASVCECHH